MAREGMLPKGRPVYTRDPATGERTAWVDHSQQPRETRSAPLCGAEGAESTDCAGERTERPYSGTQRDSVTVELPLPPKACHQNRSGSNRHWRDEAEASADTKRWAYLTVQRTRGSGARTPLKFLRCIAAVEFRFPDKRRRDLSNYFAACKAYFDGMTEADVWYDDSCVQEWHITRCINRDNPGLTITVYDIEGGMP